MVIALQAYELQPYSRQRLPLGRPWLYDLTPPVVRRRF